MNRSKSPVRPSKNIVVPTAGIPAIKNIVDGRRNSENHRICGGFRIAKNAMKTIDLECPSCGGNMEVDPSGREAVCSFCGGRVLLEQTDHAKAEYDRQMGKARAAEEMAHRRRQTERKKKLIVIGVLLLLAAIGVVYNMLDSRSELYKMLHPVTADPFEAVTVSFSGDDGSGKAELENKAAGEMRGVSFTVTPEQGLYNGDTFTVTVGSLSGYRFEPKEKTYTVSGLTVWISRPDQISQGDMETLHANTRRLIEQEWDKIVQSGKAVSYETEPLGQYFFVEDDSGAYTKNHLYDAFCTVVTKSDGETLTVYQACKYEDLRIPADGKLTAWYGDMQGFNLGYSYGFYPDSAFSGWLGREEMEADLRAVREGCTLVE